MAPGSPPRCPRDRLRTAPTSDCLPPGTGWSRLDRPTPPGSGRVVHDVDHRSVRCPDEEAADAPRLGGPRVHDLVAEFLRLRVGSVDVVGEDGDERVLGRRGVARDELDVRAGVRGGVAGHPAHVELLGAQAEVAGVEALRRLDVGHREIGDDAGGAHAVLLPGQSSSSSSDVPAGTCRAPPASSTTSPTPQTPGGRTPSSAIVFASPSRVVRTVRWVGVEPSVTTATGVDGARPCSISAAAMAGGGSRPMRTTAAAMPGAGATPMSPTRVPRSRPRDAQSTSDCGCPGGTCPETTTNSWVSPRCVTGMPASPGTPIAEVTPGTTSTGMPAATHASSSSIPRPNTNGSPPLSRTTRRPARAWGISRPLICSSPIDRPRGSFEASMTPTAAGSEASNDCGARWSARTTSACDTACWPRTVISPGSPGPPPTSTTEPGPPAGPARPARAAIVPSVSPATTASRTPTARCGSPPPCTPTTRSPCRPTAGVHTEDADRSSARAQKIRSPSASAATAALTSGSSVAATAYQAPSRSPRSYRRRTQVIDPGATRASSAAVTSGETTVTT